MNRLRAFLRLLLLALSVSLLSDAAQAASGGVSAWQELHPRLREQIAPKVSLRVWERRKFLSWYVKNLCPSAHGQAYEEPSPPECPSKKTFEAEYFYNVVLNLKQRVSLACVIWQLTEAFPRFPDDPMGIESIRYVGETASILFEVTNIQVIKKAFVDHHDFTTANGAAYERVWGLRSRRSGAHLHVEQTGKPFLFGVHIDLHNPGKVVGLNSLDHLFFDSIDREKNYTPARILASTSHFCGIGASDIHAASAE